MTRWLVVLTGAIMLTFPQSVRSQESIRISGTSFGDYYYVASSPADDDEGLNGFTFRRLYITTDFTLADGFSGRARLEAGDGNVGSKGMEPFIKDLYLRWRSDTGHSVRLGIVPTPHWDTSEDIWDYRSLEETVLDLNGIASSRDMGVRVDGPLAGDGQVAYSVMLANNSGTLPETDEGKRVYGQLQTRPSEELVLTFGGDYAGYTDERDHSWTAHAFGGYVTDRFTMGVEPFLARVTFDSGTETDRMGIGIFARGSVTEKVELVGRTDFVRTSVGDTDLDSIFALFAVAYKPVASVRLMPNVWILDEGDDGALVMGRFTFAFSF